MLATVALVTCFLCGATAQDANLGRVAFIRLMSGCLGETPYREYLDSVAAARRECGGGGDSGGFFPGLGSIFLNRPLEARFPPAQGPVFSQPGAVLLQRPTGFSPLPGVFTQQPRVISQGLELFTQQPGVFSSQPIILTQQPETVFQQGFITQLPGVVAQQPGIFPQESEIFPSLLGGQSSTTQSTPTDSVPLISVPVGPSLRGVRQKRQVTLNLADIQRTSETMQTLVNNFTCILNKLAVVNSNLDLNHRGLLNSVVNLPVAPELKQDLFTAINFCRDLTACLPLEKQQLPVPRKLQRIMDYVKCEKEMRLKACHKHNLRQSLQNLNISLLPHFGGRSSAVEDVVNLLVDSQSAHQLELI